MEESILLVGSAERITMRYTAVTPRLLDWAHRGMLDTAFKTKLNAVKGSVVRIMEMCGTDWVFELCTSVEYVELVLSKIQSGELRPEPYQILNDNIRQLT